MRFAYRSALPAAVASPFSPLPSTLHRASRLHLVHCSCSASCLLQYYALEAEREIDNPDQRIAEDVRAFTRVSLEFLITIITSVIDLASFSVILYKIYPELFAAIIAYAGAGTAIAAALGAPLVGLNFDQLQKEADFRYSLIRVRENSESIGECTAASDPSNHGSDASALDAARVRTA